MIGTGRITEILNDVQGFKNVSPTILASGDIGLFYINTEKLVQDSGAWENPAFEDNSRLMINHACEMAMRNPTFKEVIMYLSMQADQILDTHGMNKQNIAISGGQRRDWLFSGPVAAILGLPHVSLYKQEEGKPDRIEVVKHDTVNTTPDLRGAYVLQVVDLMTSGSSIYRDTHKGPRGWAPMLRNAGATIDHVITVVSRAQGGEEAMQAAGIDTIAAVTVDDVYLRMHATDVNLAIASRKEGFTKKYLTENGAISLIEAFDPNTKKKDKSKAFLAAHAATLRELGRYDEFANAVQEKYGYDIRTLE